MGLLPFINKHKVDSDKFLSLEISSNEIRCLAFFDETHGVKVIGTGVRNIEPGTVRAGVILEPEYIANIIKSVVNEASSNSETPIKKAIFGVNGTLCLGLMTTVRAKRPKTKPVDKEEIQNLSDKLSESAIIQAQNEYLQITGNSDPELETITESTVYNKIDNETVSDLEGKYGAVAETAVFSAFTPRFYIKSIQDITKRSGLQLMTIAPLIYAISQSVISSQDNVSDFVLIEVNNDNTNVAVVFGKGIVSTRVLSIGVINFIEGVSERMGLTRRDAEKMLKSYISGQLTQSEATIVKSALDEVTGIWLSGIEILFSEYTGVKTFPQKVFLTGSGAEIPDLWNMLTQEPWTKAIPFKEPPLYKKITFLDLTKISDATGKASSPEWLPVACLSKIYQEMKGR